MSGIVSKNGGRSSGIVGAGDVGADAVDGSNIADDAIDSEHYADGSIDNAHIADDAIDSEHYAAGSIDTAHIADNQITLAKMAGGTDGQIITYDASGDPVAVGPGTDGQVLTSTGAGSPPAFETAAGVSETQGTFTSSWGGSGGQSGQSYAHQYGQYNKIGNFVHCTIFCNLTDKGTLTGQVSIDGLPYTNRGNNYNPVSFCQDVYFSLTSGHVLRGYMLSNATEIQFMEQEHNNDAYTFLTTSHMNDNTGLQIMCAYHIAD